MNSFEDDLGVFVGPATDDDAIKALDDHTPGEWVIRLTDLDGKAVWHKTGWSWYLVQNDEEAMFGVFSTESGAGNPSLSVDAPIILSFGTTTRLTCEASFYTAGLAFRFAFGDYAGHTLAMIAWHSVLHLTDSGDVAPGFGSSRSRFTNAKLTPSGTWT